MSIVYCHRGKAAATMDASLVISHGGRSLIEARMLRASAAARYFARFYTSIIISVIDTIAKLALDVFCVHTRAQKCAVY